MDSNKLKKLLQLDYLGKNLEITKVNDFRYPEKNTLLFVKDKKKLEIIEKGNCFFCDISLKDKIKIDPEKCFFFSENFLLDFITILNFFDPYKKFANNFPQALTSARVEKNPHLANDLRFGPFVSLGEEVQIGAGCVLKGHNQIGHRVVLGNNVTIHAGVIIKDGTVIGDNTTIYDNSVVGGCGFGFEKTAKGIIKIPQIGNVIIGKNVEIGSNVAIDRATINATIIEDNVKIDNLVQIAHNVMVGKNSIIVSQTGIAGSSTIQEGVILAGQVGISDHVVIEKNAMIGPQSGIPAHKVVREGEKILGSPGMDIYKRLRMDLFLEKLYNNKNK